MTDQLTRIEKMLTAVLKSGNHIHWIGGYVYGRTSNDDPFILLYPAADNLNEKIVRVYPQDFKKLPAFIDTGDVPADTENNPNKGQAQKKGIYHTCPLFQIVTYDGKETQMGPEKRFGDVVRVKDSPTLPAQNGRISAPPPAQNGQPVSRINRPAAPAAQPATPPAAPKSNNPIPPKDWELDALTSTDPLMFDTAVVHVITWFKDATQVTTARETMFGAWVGARAPAYLAGLKTYARKRDELESDGQPATAAHKQAKTEAGNHYRRELQAAGMVQS